MIRSYPRLIVVKSLIGSKLHPPPFPTTQAYHHVSFLSATKCLIHPVPGQSKSFAKMAANSKVQEVKGNAFLCCNSFILEIINSMISLLCTIVDFRDVFKYGLGEQKEAVCLQREIRRFGESVDMG